MVDVSPTDRFVKTLGLVGWLAELDCVRLLFTDRVGPTSDPGEFGGEGDDAAHDVPVVDVGEPAAGSRDGVVKSMLRLTIGGRRPVVTSDPFDPL